MIEEFHKIPRLPPGFRVSLFQSKKQEDKNKGEEWYAVVGPNPCKPSPISQLGRGYGDEPGVAIIQAYKMCLQRVEEADKLRENPLPPFRVTKRKAQSLSPDDVFEDIKGKLGL